MKTRDAESQKEHDHLLDAAVKLFGDLLDGVDVDDGGLLRLGREQIARAVLLEPIVRAAVGIEPSSNRPSNALT